MIKRCFYLAFLLIFSNRLLASFEQEDFEFLFVDAYLNGTSLDFTYDAISADFKTLYIPLDQLFESLNFAIEIEHSAGGASGWYIREENKFSIDLLSKSVKRTLLVTTSDLSALSAFGEVTSDLKEFNWHINEGQIIIFDDSMYISQHALRRWLDIDSQIRFGRLMINLMPKEELPQEARLKRQKKHQLLAYKRNQKLQYKMQVDQYHWLTDSGIDFSYNLHRIQKVDGELQQSEQIGLKSSFDLLKHGLEFSLNKSPAGKNARLKFARRLILNKRDWNYSVGDVRPIGDPLIPSSKLGRGISINSSPFDQFVNFTRRIEGLGYPGWEAELYRDNNVMDYQVIGDNGFYLFDNVPLRLGKNKFTVVLYGPQGEKEQIPYDFYSNNHKLNKGDWKPEISLIQQDTPLLFSDNSGEIDSRLRLNVGLTNSLAASFAYFNLDLGSNSSSHIVNSLYGAYDGLSFFLNYGHEISTGANSTAINSQFNWRDQDIRFSIQEIERYVLSNDSFTRQHSANIGITGDFKIIDATSNYSIDISKNNSELNLYSQLSTQIFGLNIHNSNIFGIDNNNFDGNLNLRLNLFSTKLKGALKYSVKPFRTIRQLDFSWNGSWNQYNWQLQFLDDREFQRKRLSMSLGRSFDSFKVNVGLSYEQNETKFIFGIKTSFNTSTLQFGNNNFANSSSVKALAYLDQNINGKFDSADIPINGVKFRGNSAWKELNTNSEGVVVLPSIPANRIQKIEVDTDSVEDPFWRVNGGAYKFRSHAGGRIELDFGFVQTVELEGEVALWSSSKQILVRKGGIPICLKSLSGKVIKKTKTQFDGFYIFDDIQPGEYMLTIDEAYLKEKSLSNFKAQRLSLYPASIDDVTFYAEVITLGKPKS